MTSTLPAVQEAKLSDSAVVVPFGLNLGNSAGDPTAAARELLDHLAARTSFHQLAPSVSLPLRKKYLSPTRGNLAGSKTPFRMSPLVLVFSNPLTFPLSFIKY